MSDKKKGTIREGSFPAENQYITKTKEEIRQLALDNMAGQVFASWQMREHEKNHMSMVFLPLIAINDFHIKSWERDGIIHLYGHMKDAINRSINGMPIFYSCYEINQSDLERVFKMQRLIEALDEPE